LIKKNDESVIAYEVRIKLNSGGQSVTWIRVIWQRKV